MNMQDEIESPDSTLNSSGDSADLTFRTAIGDDLNLTNNNHHSNAKDNNSLKCSPATTANCSENFNADETLLCVAPPHAARLQNQNGENAPFLTHVVSDSDVNLHLVADDNAAAVFHPTSPVASSLDVAGSHPEPTPLLPVGLSTPKKKGVLGKLDFSSSPSLSPMSDLPMEAAGPPPSNRRIIGTVADDLSDPDSPSYTMRRMGIIRSQHSPLVTSSGRFFSSSNAPESSDTSATVNINLQVNTTLPCQPLESVVRDSNLLFGTFFNVRFEMEVEGRGTPSIVTAQARANATVNTSIPVPSTSRQQVSPLEPEYGHSFDPIYNPHVRDMFNEVAHADPGTEIENVARQLAVIGDDINDRYGARLDELIRSLGFNQSPFEMFKQVALAIFDRGPTNWGKIVALFYFGYRLALNHIREGIAGAIRMVIDGLCDFCRRSNIFNWIARQGGWFIMTYLCTPTYSFLEQSSAEVDDASVRNNSTDDNEGLLGTISNLTSSWRLQWLSERAASQQVLAIGTVVIVCLCLGASFIRRSR